MTRALIIAVLLSAGIAAQTAPQTSQPTIEGVRNYTKVVDEFLKIVADTVNQPLFIHCGSANRVGSMWLIKRMVIDQWTEERAVAEAKSIGLTSAAFQKFALDYVATHKLG